MEHLDFRVAAILAELADKGSEANRAGMARYGVNVERVYGVKIPVLRAMAKKLSRDQDLAEALWATGQHEARILAGYIGEPQKLTRAQVDAWVADFDSWDLCDQVTDLFLPCPFLDEAIRDYAADEREFVRRAGFSLIAARAVRDKKGRPMHVKLADESVCLGPPPAGRRTTGTGARRTVPGTTGARCTSGCSRRC
jgi:3-methyladenine DNA glycosylase AlkD